MYVLLRETFTYLVERPRAARVAPATIEIIHLRGHRTRMVDTPGYSFENTALDWQRSP
jgi:hypothetical protein